MMGSRAWSRAGRRFTELQTRHEQVEKQLVQNQSQRQAVEQSLDAPLSRAQYLQYLSECRKGDINVVSLVKQRLKLYLVGTNYSFNNSWKMYQLLNRIRPKRVLLQMRPDQIFENFRYFPVYPSKAFNSELYFSQLEAQSAEELVPSRTTIRKIKHELLKHGVLIEPLNGQHQYEEFRHGERLDDSLIGTCAMWGMRNKFSNLMLCDLPDRIYREAIANSFSLLELKRMLEECALQKGYSADEHSGSLLETAVRTFPDVFLHFSDRYIASLILSLANARDEPEAVPESWVAFCGIGQSRSIERYLERLNGTPRLEDCLTVPDRFTTIIRRETVDMLIEKIAVLEVLFRYPRAIGKRAVELECPLSCDWIRREVRDELGIAEISTRIELYTKLYMSLFEDIRKRIQQGTERQSKELKRKLLLESPLLKF